MNTVARPSALRTGCYALDGGVLVKVSTEDRSLVFSFGEGSPAIPIIKSRLVSGGWEIEYYLNRKKQTGKLTIRAT